MPERKKNLNEWIDYAHSLGLSINNMCQLPDGKWRVGLRVFPATADLARDPEFTDYADRETPEECFEAVFASKRYVDSWSPKAKLAVAAMADPSKCIATLILADRPRVNANRAATLLGMKADVETPKAPEKTARQLRLERLLGDA